MARITVALACPKTIQLRPLTSVKIKIQNQEVGLWGLPLKEIDHGSRLPVFPPPTCGINCLQVPPQWFARFQAKWRRVKDVIIYANHGDIQPALSTCLFNLTLRHFYPRVKYEINSCPLTKKLDSSTIYTPKVNLIYDENLPQQSRNWLS